MLVDPPLHPGQPHNRGHAGPGSKLEPLDRGPHPERLVRPFGVVVDHPRIQSLLQLLHGGVPIVVLSQELRTYRLVPPLHLPGSSRRPRRGQQMPDPVLGADPIEQHLRRTSRGPEPAGEDFPIEFLTDVKLRRLV